MNISLSPRGFRNVISSTFAMATALFALLPLLIPTGQAPPTLADFLSRSKVAGRFVVDAEHVTAKATKPDLEAFGRKEVKVGGVATIVPRQMVLIDDGLTQSPNLYEGLPRSAKVLYLLSTLNAEQLRLATGPGIGAGDLRGEQVAVFRSLLPPSFSWGTFLVDKDGIPQAQGDGVTVSGPDLGRVKLRFSRQVMLLPTRTLPGGRTSFSYMDQGREMVPGQVVRMRSGDTAGDGDDRLYGVLVRRVVANQPKRGDLDYSQSRLGATISVPSQTTVRELLEWIGAATKTEFAADFRVRDLSVSFAGKGRAGDLLQALALAVTGTYRKVGNTFLLTSDLEGQGARQLKLALWASAVGVEAERRSREWRSKVGASGALKLVGFSADDPTGPNDTMKARLQQEEGSLTHKPLAFADLSQAAQESLNQFAKFSNAGSYDQAGVTSRIVYSYVLPDGTALEPEHEELGRADQFYEPAMAPPRTGIRPVERPIRAPLQGATKSVIFHATDAMSAQAAVEAASSFGLNAIWIETFDGDALAAAVSAGKAKSISVGLVIRPWQALGSEPPSELDQTLIPSQHPHLVSPTSSVVVTRSKKVSALAATPGLAGILILEVQPKGYEPSDQLGGYPLGAVSQVASEAFGYGLGARSGFLRANQIDPIDIGQEGLQMPVNLRVPFFEDRAFAKSDQEATSPYKWFEKWRTYRSELNRKAYEGFFASLGRVVPPVFAEPRVENATSASRSVIWAQPWQLSQPIPSVASRSSGASGSPDSIGITLLTPDILASEDLTGRQLTLTFRSNRNPMALDLSGMSVLEATEFLGKWLARG